MMPNKKAYNRGFTLVQMSVLLMVASIIMVSILPSTQKTLDANRVTTERMNELMKYFRVYMASTGGLPCPADATLATGAANYGVMAAGAGPSTDCTGSTPAANYTDASNNVAIGMVPYKTMGIPRELVYDGWGRAITYAVDTNVTDSCWPTPITGSITVTDKGNAQTAVIALVSHGANGHGAWTPLTGNSGTGVRLNNNSSNSDELTNAHVNSGFAATAVLNNFVIATPGSTFDDIIVYKSPLWTMNARPALANTSSATITGVSTPGSGYYYHTSRFAGTNFGATIPFTVTFNKAVTVSGVPRLAITAISVGGGSVAATGNSGSGGTGYANYVSGSGTSSLVFNYPVQATDMAPNGFTMASALDLNGGSVTPICNLALTPPTLTGVIIPKVSAITASTSYTVPADWNNAHNVVVAVGSGGNGAVGAGNAGGGGGGGGATGVSQQISLTPGDSVTVTVGTAGGTAKTLFKDSSTLEADYGRNASASTGGAGGSSGNGDTTVIGASSYKYAGGSGAAGGASNRGGGGGGGGAGGGNGNGASGAAGNVSGGGGGGGGGANGGADGNQGGASGGSGGDGGPGADGVAGGNSGTAGGGNAAPGSATAGSGGGGGGGSNAVSTNAGAGGNGGIALTNGVALRGWTTNIVPIGDYGVGSGAGGSGGANGATSNTTAAGSAASYGGGGGGSGAATGSAGAAGSGYAGLVIIGYR